MTLQGASKFHAHLDICEQCRENPTQLCLRGQNLLYNAVQDLEGPENLVDAGPNIREWLRKKAN